MPWDFEHATSLFYFPISQLEVILAVVILSPGRHRLDDRKRYGSSQGSSSKFSDKTKTNLRLRSSLQKLKYRHGVRVKIFFTQVAIA